MAGCGNTNNGNTARRFFQQPNLAAQITGVSEDIIIRLSVILRAMACEYDVNPEAFLQQLKYMLMNIHGFTCLVLFTKF